MATSSGGGVLAEVQRQLAAGWSDEEILAALTAKGLSPASAERFLQRARPPGSAPPPLPAALPPPLPALPPPVDPVDAEAATVAFAAPVPSPPSASADPPSAASKLGVIGGSVVMTLGLIALAWALGQERVRIRVPLALTLSGAAWLASAARAVVDPRRPASWLLPGTAAAPPALAALAVVGAVLTTGTPKPPPDVSEIATSVPERRAPGPNTRTSTRDTAIARFVEQLHDPSAGDPCQAAQRLAMLPAREAVPDLMRFLETSTENDRKVCAAHALAMLGEGPAMLPIYLEWLQSDTDLLVHHAIVGFGHIGPSAAHEAVPALQDALADGPSDARRWVIVSTLARLGPSAAPALQRLVDDENANVRTAAQKALEKLR